MKDYVIKKDEYKIRDAHRAAETCLNKVRNFVQAYNELRDEAFTMPETQNQMPQLDTKLLAELLKRPTQIENLYFETIKVPELAGGFKVKMETLDIDHADFNNAIAYSKDAYQAINANSLDGLDISAYVVREEGTNVIISDKWKAEVEERNTKRAETPVEKKMYDALKQILAIREDVERTTGIKIDFNRIYPGMGDGRPFGDIYYNILRHPGRSELIEQTEKVS